MKWCYEEQSREGSLSGHSRRFLDEAKHVYEQEIFVPGRLQCCRTSFDHRQEGLNVKGQEEMHAISRGKVVLR